MTLVLVLTLLVLQSFLSASLPTNTFGAPELLSSLDAPAVQDVSRVDAAVEEPMDAGRGDEDSQPIALLVGRDVKRVIRRKGSSDAKQKFFKQKDTSHLISSHEWSQVSGLDHILDPVSFEDPEDVELKTAIAQLLKEVAHREEKRKMKQNVDSNEEDLRILDDDGNDKSQSGSTDHHDEAKLPEDDSSDETIVKGDDHHDEVSDDLDDAHYQSGSGDEYVNSSSNDDDFDSTENEYDYVEDTVKNDHTNTLGDNDQSEQHSNEQHNDSNDLKEKISLQQNQYSQVSKEVIEEKGHENNDNVNKKHLDDPNNITPEKSKVDVDEDKLEYFDDNHQTRSHNDDNDSQDSHNKKHENIDVKIPQEPYTNNNNDNNISKYEVHKDLKSSHHHGDKKYYQFDKTEDQSPHDLTSNQQYSFENYDTVNDDSGNVQHHLNKIESQNILVNQSPEDLNRVENNLRNDLDSKNLGIKNDNNQNDLNLKLENPTEDIDKKLTEDKIIITNHIVDAVKEPQTDNNDPNPKVIHENSDEKHIHEYDSVEIGRYNRIPQRRYNSRYLKHDRISKSYQKSRRQRPIKQYTLSFYLRK